MTEKRAATRYLAAGIVSVVAFASAAAWAEAPSIAVLPAEGEPTLAARVDAGLALALVKGGHRGVLTPVELAERLRGDGEAAAALRRGEALLGQANRALLHLRRPEAVKRANEAVVALKLGNARFHARPLLGRAYGTLALGLMLKPSDAGGAKQAFTAALHADATFRPDADRTPPRVMERFNAAKQASPVASVPTTATLLQVASRARVQRLVWVGVTGRGTAAHIEMLIFEAKGKTGVQLHKELEQGALVSGASALATKHLPAIAQPASTRPVHRAAIGLGKKPASQPVAIKKDNGKRRLVVAKPWYKRWWVWAIVGTVAASSVGVAIIATRQGNSADDGYQFVFKY